MSLAFPSIVIPALTGISNDLNKYEKLSMTPIEVSWFGMLTLQDVIDSLMCYLIMIAIL